MNPTSQRLLSLLDIPAEIRLKIYPYVFRGAIITFDRSKNKWCPRDDGATLVFVCKALYEEAIQMLWSEVMLELPDCRIPWGLDLSPYRSVSTKIHDHIRAQVRHPRVSKEFQPQPLPLYDYPRYRSLCDYPRYRSYSKTHLPDEVAWFCNVETLTVSFDWKVQFQSDRPQAYADILKFVRIQTQDFRSQRSLLPSSVALQFECFIYHPKAVGMVVTTDEKCKPILGRQDTKLDQETKSVIITSTWAQEELRQWTSLVLARQVAVTVLERSLKRVGKYFGFTEPSIKLKEAVQLQELLLTCARPAALVNRVQGL